jgi:Flp pilus assembly protein TadB
VPPLDPVNAAASHSGTGEREHSQRAAQLIVAPAGVSRTRRPVADMFNMARRLAMRDRLVWIVVVCAAAFAAYVFLPLWVIIAAAAVLLGAPLVVRRNRRSRARR